MSESADPMIGKQLGQYRIRGVLGRGGMGAVYRAEDISLARDVAVKILPAELTQPDSERFQRFLREARSAAKLNHPNVVTIYQFGVQEGKYFIVMELVEGSTLVEILQRHGPIDVRRATNIIIQAARALGAAHAGGIVHRDVKPGNIMVTRGTGMVKVADFGLAKVSSMGGEITQAGDVVGTPLYMSPEQCRGEPADLRSDIYSLCMTYYRLVTGVLPFEAENTHATMYKQIHEPVPDPRIYVPNIPPQVVAAIFKGLAKDPGRRYSTAAELERTLLMLDLSPGAAATLPDVANAAPPARMASGIIDPAFLAAVGVAPAHPPAHAPAHQQHHQQPHQQPHQHGHAVPTGSRPPIPMGTPLTHGQAAQLHQQGHPQGHGQAMARPVGAGGLNPARSTGAVPALGANFGHAGGSHPHGIPGLQNVQPQPHQGAHPAQHAAPAGHAQSGPAHPAHAHSGAPAHAAHAAHAGQAAMVMGHPVEGDNTLAQLAAVRDVRAGGAATVVRLGGQHNSVSPGAGELRNVAGRNVWTLAAFAALFAVGSFGVTWLLLGVLGGGGTQAGTKDAVKDVTRDAPKDNGTPGSGNGTGTGGTNERETRENEAWEQLHAIENTPRVSARDRADDLKRKVVDAYPGTRAADVASRKITELQTEIEREGQKSRAAEIRWRTVVRDLDKYDDDKQKIRLVQNFLANAEFDGTEAAKQARKLLDDLRRKAGPGGLDGESDPTGKTKKRPPLPPVDPVMPVTKGTG